MAKVAITCDESGHGALIAGGCGTAFGDRVLAEIDLGKNLPRGLSRRVDSDRPPRRCPGFDPPLAIGYFCSTAVVSFMKFSLGNG